MRPAETDAARTEAGRGGGGKADARSAFRTQDKGRRTINAKEISMNRIMLRAAAVGTAMMLAAAGCKNDTPSAPEPKPVPVFTGITDLQTYLEGQQLVPLKLSVDLSGDNLPALFAALNAAGKYVSLDLSGCTGLTEWGKHTDVGAGRIVSLVLPDSVAEIAEGTTSAGTFASFTSLETLTANGVETVGSNALRRCAALTSISMPAATAIKDYAFGYNALLKTANLPAATAIEAGAFYGCSVLTSISLPSAVTIKDSAFNSTALASVSLPKAATIGNYAFSGTALASADLPAATAIGTGAFNSCAALASINLPEAADIGEGAFRGCAALASISLPAATAIKTNAFYSCTALASVNIPAAADIGNYAFAFTALASIDLPAATVIGEGAFAGCTGLTDIRISSDNPNYTVKDGMLLNKAETALFAYLRASGAITLPSVTTVGAYAFGSSALTSANLPAATVIGEGAFQNCAALASANLPAAAAIGTNAFYSCTALASLTLGTALPTLGNPSVFYNVGKDTEEGFTICVPDETAQAELETAIATTGNWHTALTDTTWRGIYQGNFKGVEVTQ
jgi:hypothetical protein